MVGGFLKTLHLIACGDQISTLCWMMIQISVTLSAVTLYSEDNCVRFTGLRISVA
jgi:hypothetical protein